MIVPEIYFKKKDRMSEEIFREIQSVWLLSANTNRQKSESVTYQCPGVGLKRIFPSIFKPQEYILWNVHPVVLRNGRIELRLKWQLTYITY